MENNWKPFKLIKQALQHKLVAEVLKIYFLMSEL